MRFLRTLSLSRLNYRLAYVTDGACVAVFAYLGVGAGCAWHVALASAFAGAFVFSFVEYGLHRWMFHDDSLLAGEVHTAHHREPATPTALPFASSAAMAPLLFWVLSGFAGAAVAHWALCGFFAAYCCYGVLHHLQHSIRINDVPFGALRRKWIAHAVHHGRGTVNFGVTTSLWDRVFGTYRASSR